MEKWRTQNRARRESVGGESRIIRDRLRRICSERILVREFARRESLHTGAVLKNYCAENLGLQPQYPFPIFWKLSFPEYIGERLRFSDGTEAVQSLSPTKRKKTPLLALFSFGRAAENRTLTSCSQSKYTTTILQPDIRFYTTNADLSPARAHSQSKYTFLTGTVHSLGLLFRIISQKSSMSLAH